MKSGFLKKMLLGTLGLLVFLVAGTTLTLSLVDWNKYRDTIEEAAAAGLGVQVDLSGDIGVAVFPRPTLEAETVTLYSLEASDSDVIATAKRIDIQLALAALLSGNIQLENLELVGLQIAVEENASGNWALKGWPVADETSTEDQEDDSSTTLQLDRLSLAGAEITIHRANNDVRYIKSLDLNLSGTFPKGPIDWDGQFFLDDQKVGIDGRLRPVLADNALSLRAGFNVDGGMATWSGRFGGEDTDIVGRLVVEGSNTANFISSLTSAAGLPHQITSEDEEAPFLVDLQVEGRGDILTIVSKQLNINGSVGRLDLTLASNEEISNITGTLALSIIDTEKWQTMALVSDAEEAPTNEPASKVELPFTGGIDVTIEGIRVAGDMVQNIDFTVDASDSALSVSKFQALFPGGTAVAARGSVNTGAALSGDGAISVISSRLPTFLEWAGVDVKDKVPAGRLATAKLASRLRFDEAGWQLVGFNGNIDTANFEGALSGTYSAPFLANIDLAVDQINLDAYLPETQEASASGEAKPASNTATPYFPDNAVKFDLKGQKLLLRGRQYTAVGLKGVWSSEGAKVENGSARLGEGSVSFTGGINSNSTALSYEFNAGFADFPVEVIASEAPSIAQYTNALALRTATGSVSLSGPLEDLTLSAKMDHGNGKVWNLTGSLALDNLAPAKLDLQGSVKHRNVAPLIRDYGLDAAVTPIDLTLTVNKTDASAPIKLRSTGQAGDARVILDVTSAETAIDGNISYDHPKAYDFIQQFGLTTQLPNPSESLHLKVKASYSDEEWAISDIDVANGQATVKGALTANKSKIINGDLRLANWTTVVPESASSGSNETGSKEAEFSLADFADYAGSISLNMNRVNILGQTLTIANGALQMGDGVAFVNLGTGAQLNGSPLSGSLNVTMDPKPNFALKLDVSNIDIAAMLVGAGYSDVVSGSTALALDISAQGNTVSEILGSLRGSGNLNGQAGVLNFLDVPTLISDIEAATSGRAFLNLIGSRLRGGQTNFGAMQASFTLDSGIALVEEFKASGNWGVLELGGQLNLLDEFMDMSGALALARPLDAPAVPVNYKGSLSAPSGGWASRALEKFVIAGIERRFRSSIFNGLEKAQSESGKERAPSAGSSVFDSAVSILGQIRKRQKDKKAQEAEEASKKADDGNNGSNQ